MTTNSAPVDLSAYNVNSEAGAAAVQQILRGAGLYTGAIDGDFGPLSQKALAEYKALFPAAPHGRVYQGTNGYHFSTYIDGDDLCADGIPGTCFGGPRDPQDNGRTASGILLRNHPTMLVVSLPMSYCAACHGSPFGHFLGWGTAVKVSRAIAGSQVFDGILEECGPSAYTGNGVDCYDPLARALTGHRSDFNPNLFKMPLNVRVIGGAKRMALAA